MTLEHIRLRQIAVRLRPHYEAIFGLARQPRMLQLKTTPLDVREDDDTAQQIFARAIGASLRFTQAAAFRD